jgi:hypothetical protein
MDNLSPSRLDKAKDRGATITKKLTQGEPKPETAKHIDLSPVIQMASEVKQAVDTNKELAIIQAQQTERLITVMEALMSSTSIDGVPSPFRLKVIRGNDKLIDHIDCIPLKVKPTT